jgi:murein DD-endopeptidase MepM/ murein hydrolase activator NlpD
MEQDHNRRLTADGIGANATSENNPPGLRSRSLAAFRASVKVGQMVKRGEEIGAVGTTGLSVGPHLHYEVLVNGRHSNPRRYILDMNVLPD